MRIFFTATLFLSSTLLFLIQPMIAKMILPKFGGSPAVWNAAMLFFQAMLLAGYLYAHFATKWLGPKRQAILHVGVLALALLTLPFSIPALYAPNPAGAQAPQLLALLSAQVGLVFFALSAGAPLLQRWFATTDDPAAKDPYFLYSASNLGSMLALLAYPLLLEPSFRLGQQARLWAGGYLLLSVGMAVCAGLVWKRGHRLPEALAQDALPPAIPRAQKTRWVLLAFVPTSLMLGLTNYFTIDIAPIPLIWVVPLAVYLFTYILAFRSKRLPAAQLGRFLPLLATPLALILVLEANEPLLVVGLIHLATFFVAALMCHTALVESRPPATRLTEFYLWISVGGVLGGAFNALLAPIVFDRFIEYPLALILACLLRPDVPRSEARPRDRWLDWAYPAGLGLLMIAIVLVTQRAGLGLSGLRTAILLGLPLILVFLAVDRKLRFALSLGVFFWIANLFTLSTMGRLIEVDRSFFGVHRVIESEDGRARELYHGKTIHGRQWIDPAFAQIPLTYYTESGPIGQVFSAWQGEERLRRVGLVGLGVGTLAAYGKPGQTFTFYEIDPLVVRLAENPQRFSFLSASRADVRVVLGDARLQIEKAEPGYDLLVLDAFSSDAVPVHLLTRQAMALYLDKLSPNGVLAFHISNLYLDLAPVVAKTGETLGLRALYQADTELTEEDLKAGKSPSQWMLLARAPEDLMPLAQDPRWERYLPPERAPVWTDDFSNLLGALQRRHSGED